MKIMQEITKWAVEYRQPNHVYLMDGDKVYAASRWGEDPPQYFQVPLRINRGGRKFVEVPNQWGFRTDITTEPESITKPAGESWTVTGSRGDQYTVTLESGRWSCTCSGFGFRGRCRHITEQQAKG